MNTPIAPKGLAKDFWKKKPLTEMSPEEWEALCDGCGKCCLNKLEDEDTQEVAWTMRPAAVPTMSIVTSLCPIVSC